MFVKKFRNISVFIFSCLLTSQAMAYDCSLVHESYVIYHPRSQTIRSVRPVNSNHETLPLIQDTDTPKTNYQASKLECAVSAAEFAETRGCTIERDSTGNEIHRFSIVSWTYLLGSIYQGKITSNGIVSVREAERLGGSSSGNHVYDCRGRRIPDSLVEQL